MRFHSSVDRAFSRTLSAAAASLSASWSALTAPLRCLLAPRLMPMGPKDKPMGPSKSPAPTPPEPLPLCASSLPDLPFSTEEQASTRSARLFARAPLQGCETRANTVLVIPSMLVNACATKVLPDKCVVLALSQLKLKRSPVVLQVTKMPDENFISISPRRASVRRCV